MRTSPLLLAPTVLSLLFLGSGHYVAGLELKDASKKGDHGADGPEVTVTSRIAIPSKSETSTVSELSSETDYDYSEEYDNEPQVSGSIVDDSVRVEQVVKPSQNQTESEKTSDKPKRRKKTGKNGKNRRNKKKKTPCDAEFQNFCIHGECKYIEHLTAVTCKCHQDYFGERCGEKTMKTQRIVNSDLSKVALVAVVAFVSAMILTVTVVVITSQLRKRYFSEYEGESEETKKLRKENNAHTIV